MNFDQVYTNQVNLLLDVLPIVNQFDCFALKGGTAINLFIRDMPRLSVDIDLAYLLIEPREMFLENISSEILKMKKMIEKKYFRVQETYTKDKQVSKLIVYGDQANIKIEPNLVIRGAVFSCEEYDLCQRAQEQFLRSFRIKTLSLADLYGGKICAALSRQHPRDLFDVKLLLENQGLTDQVRQAFIVYLASNPRPMHELLNPASNLKAFRKTFEEGFVGMTDVSISHQELIEVQHVLIQQLLETLTIDERQFLLSIKSGEPNWSLMPMPNIDKFPAIQWKVINIKKMTKEKQQTALEKLRSVLEI